MSRLSKLVLALCGLLLCLGVFRGARRIGALERAEQSDESAFATLAERAGASGSTSRSARLLTTRLRAGQKALFEEASLSEAPLGRIWAMATSLGALAALFAVTRVPSIGASATLYKGLALALLEVSSARLTGSVLITGLTHLLYNAMLSIASLI